MSGSKPILFSYWRSSCAWRVRIALNLKKVDYDYRTVNLLSKEDMTSPEFLKVNPAAKVPALVVNGVSLTESMAIMEFLDEVYPDRSPLLPKDPIERAHCRAIALQQRLGDLLKKIKKEIIRSTAIPSTPVKKSKNSAVNSKIIVANIQPIQNTRILKYLNEETPGSGAKWAKHWLTDGLRDLEALVSRSAGTYAVGEKISIADLCIPSIMYNAKRWGVDTSAFPTLSKIDATLAKIPEFEAAHPDKQPDANLNA